MKIYSTFLADALVLKPSCHADHRGFLTPVYEKHLFDKIIKQEVIFVQDNFSVSHQHVLRGLHYQINHAAQGKLITVPHGKVLSVGVDLRSSSPTWGQWNSQILSSQNHFQLWLPAGFAHGFYTLSQSAHIFYKLTHLYEPEQARCIVWNDPTLNIEWPPHAQSPILSKQDAEGKSFLDAQPCV